MVVEPKRTCLVTFSDGQVYKLQIHDQEVIKDLRISYPLLGEDGYPEEDTIDKSALKIRTTTLTRFEESIMQLWQTVRHQNPQVEIDLTGYTFLEVPQETFTFKMPLSGLLDICKGFPVERIKAFKNPKGIVYMILKIGEFDTIRVSYFPEEGTPSDQIVAELKIDAENLEAANSILRGIYNPSGNEQPNGAIELSANDPLQRLEARGSGLSNLAKGQGPNIEFIFEDGGTRLVKLSPFDTEALLGLTAYGVIIRQVFEDFEGAPIKDIKLIS